MKIIHTADWHLCDSLGRNDRTKDLEARVERVAALCLEHDAEVLLIAGDLFSERASVPEMTAALLHIHRVFVPFFERGGTILAITGNHDRDARINMVLAGMKLAVPVRGSGEPLPGGRLYLANSAGVVVLRSRSGQRVQFVLVPYPFASRYEISAADFPTQAEENTQIKTILADWLQKKSAEIDHALPTVLVAHLHVCGSETHSLYKITAAEDHQFQFGDLNPMWPMWRSGTSICRRCSRGRRTCSTPAASTGSISASRTTRTPCCCSKSTGPPRSSRFACRSRRPRSTPST